MTTNKRDDAHLEKIGTGSVVRLISFPGENPSVRKLDEFLRTLEEKANEIGKGAYLRGALPPGEILPCQRRHAIRKSSRFEV